MNDTIIYCAVHNRDIRTFLAVHHMSKTNIGRILESANTVDILLYIHEHPGCIKSEIYQNVTRNAHTGEKIDRLADMRLISKGTSETRNAVTLTLTDVGQRIVDLLMQAEALIVVPETSEDENE